MQTKTNVAGMFRDPKTNVVVNADNNEYAQYLQNRERAKQMKNLQAQIDEIRNECIAIREQVTKLIGNQQ